MSPIKLFSYVLIGCVLVDGVSVKSNSNENPKVIPEGISFGIASAAYQIEGGWNEDGKGWSMWDYVVRTNPSAIESNHTGDVAADSYHLYKRDVEMLKELGVDIYRFSISWPRILPYGRANYINQLGVEYYNNLINELIQNGIEPVVTIYHWDLPQNLNEQGGWLNDDIIDWFTDYASILFENFGDRVMKWITVNEPNIHCTLGYEMGVHAPLIKSPGVAYYDCTRNIMLAHAKTFHIYNDKFRSIQQGMVGLSLDFDWMEPASDSEEDLQATDDAFAFKLGQFADLLFTERANYPQIMIDRVAAVSYDQGYNMSRLRPLTEDEMSTLRFASDFMGINIYYSNKVYRNSSLTFDTIPSLDHDLYVGLTVDTISSNFNSTTDGSGSYGLYKALKYLNEYYNQPIIYITENGVSTEDTLEDNLRVEYFRSYVSALVDAKNEGVDVRGYIAWSLMDNFNWNFGYTVYMGFYKVDFEHLIKTRTPRLSALVYSHMLSTRSIDLDYKPDVTAVPAETSGAITNSDIFFVTLCLRILLLQTLYYL